MRNAWLGSVLALVLPGTVAAQDAPPAGGAQAEGEAAPADPQARLRAKIRRMLEDSGQAALAKQACDAMLAQFSRMPGLPPEFFERFREEAKAEALVEMTVPIYAKYLTEADVDALIAFHESPVGRKLATVQPALLKESMEAGQKWGAELGERVMREVLEGPPARDDAERNRAPARSPLGRNESAAIGTLRSLTVAQEQFRQQAIVDQDGDGTGEYGWLGELAGSDPVRGTGGIQGPKQATAPFIASILGVKDASGRAQKSGYYFRMFLPAAGSRRARGETQAHAGTGAAADADNQEIRWACYAWPVERGKSGTRSFFAGHQGEVYATAAAKTRYSGTTICPAADAALDTEGPDSKNLDAGIGLAAAGLTAGDGNVWVPAGN